MGFSHSFITLVKAPKTKLSNGQPDLQIMGFSQKAKNSVPQSLVPVVAPLPKFLRTSMEPSMAGPMSLPMSPNFWGSGATNCADEEWRQLQRTEQFFQDYLGVQ